MFERRGEMKFFPSPVTTDHKKTMSLEEVNQVLLLQKKVMSEQI